MNKIILTITIIILMVLSSCCKVEYVEPQIERDVRISIRMWDVYDGDGGWNKIEYNVKIDEVYDENHVSSIEHWDDIFLKVKVPHLLVIKVEATNLDVYSNINQIHVRLWVDGEVYEENNYDIVFIRNVHYTNPSTEYRFRII